MKNLMSGQIPKQATDLLWRMAAKGGNGAPVRIEEWYRLPSPRGGRLFGMSRTTLTELALAGAIKSVLLRKPGAKRGIRLIHGPSLQQYLLGEMEAQMKALSAQAKSTPQHSD